MSQINVFLMKRKKNESQINGFLDENEKIVSDHVFLDEKNEKNDLRSYFFYEKMKKRISDHEVFDEK